MSYNGHKNWNHWNVSLWLNNDVTLYDTMCWFIHVQNNKKHAAHAMLEYLEQIQNTPKPRTPDGAPYSNSSIRAAMREL